MLGTGDQKEDGSVGARMHSNDALQNKQKTTRSGKGPPGVTPPPFGWGALSSLVSASAAALSSVKHTSAHDFSRPVEAARAS